MRATGQWGLWDFDGHSVMPRDLDGRWLQMEKTVVSIDAVFPTSEISVIAFLTQSPVFQNTHPLGAGFILVPPAVSSQDSG